MVTVPRRVVGYVRVAPRERPSTRPGLGAQRVSIRDECARRGWEIVGFHQDVRSGRTLRRPGLREATAVCVAGEAEAIVVARLDRLTYSLGDLAEIVAEASEHDVGIVALDLDLDSSSPAGRLVADVLAEARRWGPRRLAVRAGRTLGARPPGRPSSTPQHLADRIRELRAGGATLQAICDTLNAEGVPTSRGGTHWRPTSLRAILRPSQGGHP